MGRFRDAITGLFTTKAAAEASPGTTVRETVDDRYRPRTKLGVKAQSEFDRMLRTAEATGMEPGVGMVRIHVADGIRARISLDIDEARS